MITILSRKPLSLPGYLLDGLMGNQYPYSIRSGNHRGPDAVHFNLLDGLQKINCDFQNNPLEKRITTNVGVLSGVKTALPWAIAAKQSGRIQKLIAGPNLVTIPSDHDSILCSDAIDLILTPSKWVTDLYLSLCPSLENHISEWPIGVDEEYWSPLCEINERPIDILVYEKIQEQNNSKIANAVRVAMEANKINYTWIKYGSYKPEQYRNLLRRSKGMIYLTESESQGVSLFEAWSCDVPVLVWDRQYWQLGKMQCPASSAPYLTASCGSKFKMLSEFNESLDEFLERIKQKIFSPRKFISEKYTLAKSAKEYVNLFTSE